MDSIALFRIIFWRNKIHFGKIFTNYPVIKITIKWIAFGNAHESLIIFQPFLYANVPPSYAPTFFLYSQTDIIETEIIVIMTKEWSYCTTTENPWPLEKGLLCYTCRSWPCKRQIENALFLEKSSSLQLIIKQTNLIYSYDTCNQGKV